MWPPWSLAHSRARRCVRLGPQLGRRPGQRGRPEGLRVRRRRRSSGSPPAERGPAARPRGHDARRRRLVRRRRPRQGPGAQRVGLVVRARASPRPPTCRRRGPRCRPPGSPSSSWASTSATSAADRRWPSCEPNGITYPSLADEPGVLILALQGKAAATPTTLVLDTQGPDRRPGQRRSRRRATLTGLVDDVLGEGAVTAPRRGHHRSPPVPLPLALVWPCSPGSSRSPRPACCPWSPGFLGYVTGLSDVALEQRGRGRLLARRAAVRRSASRVVFIAVSATASAGSAAALFAHRRCSCGSAAPPSSPWRWSSSGWVPAHAAAVLARRRPGLVGAPLLGAVFGLGWTPCIGPTLGRRPRSGVVAGGPASPRGVVLASAYCLGLGLPFLLIAAGFERSARGQAGCAGTNAADPGHRRRPAARRRGPARDRALGGPHRRVQSELVTASRRRSDDRPRRSSRPDSRPRRATTHPAAARRRGWLRFIWRQLTSMRTALSCCCCWPSPRCPGSICRSAASTRGGSANYIAQHRTARAVARPARLLRRLRLAVVRRDLPAAVRLAGRLRPAPVARSTGSAMRAQPPRAPERLERLAAHARAEIAGVARGRRVAAARAALRGKRFRVHSRRRQDPCAQRGGRLPARDRQPRLPPRAHRASSSASRSGTSSAGGATSSCRTGQTLRQHASAATTRSTPVPGSTPRTLTPFTSPCTSSTSTFEERATGGAVRAARDFTAHVDDRGPGPPRASRRSRSTTRCSPAAPRSSCSATATPR